MAAIRGKDTQPELIVRRGLHKAGFRFRLHVRALPGAPDIVLPKYGTVIFVHGCFWHVHGCANSVAPKTRVDFWHSKLAGNKARDVRHQRQLRRLGWRVITVWECQLRSRPEATMSQLARQLKRRSRKSRRLK
jgi:DNA mismatch endonuclease (patch repair protein)